MADDQTLRNPGWARLITPNYGWDAHSRVDQQMAEFIRQETDLKSDPVTHKVDPGNLDQLKSYRLILSNELRAIKDPHHWANIREYLFGGGFLYVDHCFGVSVRDETLEMKSFAQDHFKGFKHLLPGCEVKRLTLQHSIFQAPFLIKAGDMPRDTFDPDGSNAVYGIFDDDRMLVLISMAHLFCNWDRELNKPPVCRKIIANIYSYALSQ